LIRPRRRTQVHRAAPWRGRFSNHIPPLGRAGVCAARPVQCDTPVLGDTQCPARALAAVAAIKSATGRNMAGIDTGPPTRNHTPRAQ
jgi:hypothetical protein